jgi:hypothetical protein
MLASPLFCLESVDKDRLRPAFEVVGSPRFHSSSSRHRSCFTSRVLVDDDRRQEQSIPRASRGAALVVRHLEVAMTKMAFTGELNDVMDTVMANWRYL